MLRHLLRRLGHAAVTVFAVVTLVFVLIRLAPGDPLADLRESATASPEAVAQMRRNLGLDRPLHVQYVRYLAALARGDLGISIAQQRPVRDAFRDRLPNTILLALAALLIDFAVGIAVGAWQGMRHGSRGDAVLSAVSLALYSVPVFWLGIVALMVFGERLHWLPVGGAVDPVAYPSLSPAGKLLDRAQHLVLPALTLGLVGAAGTARFQRAAMLEIVRQDFVRTARAAGLSERIVRRQTLRNALLPAITLLGVALPFLLSGVVLVEAVFAWPGIGQLAADAIFTRDYPVVTGAAIVTAVLVTAGNLLADLLYRVADPRTREAG